MREINEQYSSEELITVPKKKVYTDCEGYPNENAFRDFVSKLTEADGYNLVCFTVDVEDCNRKKGYAMGTLLIRQVITDLQDYFYVFHIHGNKFNLLIKGAEDRNLLLEHFNRENNQQYYIYYGIVDDMAITTANLKQVRRIGIDRMNEHKAYIMGKAQAKTHNEKIIGDKGNTPIELQETKTRKFKETMWYGKITINEFEPELREIIVYVFPTEYKPPLQALNMVAVVDNLVDCYAYTGNEIRFGIDGMRFAVYSRYDKEGHLSITMFKSKESRSGQYKSSIECHEGICIPASFGKRVGNGQEIFPFRKNASGTYDYVLWDKKTNHAEIDTTGFVQMDGKIYAVYADDKSIDLVEQ